MTKEEIIEGLNNAAAFLAIHHGNPAAIMAAKKLIEEME